MVLHIDVHHGYFYGDACDLSGQELNLSGRAAMSWWPPTPSLAAHTSFALLCLGLPRHSSASPVRPGGVVSVLLLPAYRLLCHRAFICLPFFLFCFMDLALTTLVFFVVSGSCYMN